MKTIALLLSFVIPALAAETQWPQFRGPNGDGHSDAKGLPEKFSDSERVKWKLPVQGKAWSSPVIWDSQVWLTNANEEGTDLGVICIDKESGKILHEKLIFKVAAPQFCHKFNSYASSSPVIEDGRLYAHFGSPGTACIDTKTAEVLWERRDFFCNHFRGAGSSPIIWRNLLILHFDGSDAQFVVALDKTTGKTVWQTNRSVDHQDLLPNGQIDSEGDFRKAFATPTVVEIDGSPVLFSSGAKAHYAYEPGTGKEIWRIEERAQHSASTRPVVGDGVVYFQTGFSKAQLFAVKLGGSGVLPLESILWSEKKNVGSKPSLILDGGLLFGVDDIGIATCLDAKTGKAHWRERIGGDYSASPILAEGRLYFLSEQGNVSVVRAGPTFELLHSTKFEDGFMASPATSGNSLFVRSKTTLYRIE